MSALSAEHVAFREDHYPSPVGEAYFVLDDPACGRLEVLPSYPKVKGKGVPAPPTAYLSLPGGDCIAPAWLLVDDVLWAALDLHGVAGDIVQKTFDRFPLRWTPPSALAAQVRALVALPEAPATLPTEVRDAIARFAPALMARVALPELMLAATDALGIGLEGAVALPCPYETASAVDEAITAAVERLPDNRGFGALPLRVDLDTLLPLLGLAEVKVPSVHCVAISGALERGRRPDDGGRRWFRGSGADWLVRPLYVAVDEIVQTLALRAGIAALTTDALPDSVGGAVLPTIDLAADGITALPALSALLTPALRLVVASPGSEADDVLAEIRDGAFATEDPVSESRVEAWLPALHAHVRAARRELTAETKGKPLAFLNATLADVPGVVGTNARVLTYALELNESESILPWWESAATQERYAGAYVVDVPAYQRELAGELLRATRPEITAPIRAASDRLLRLADEIERLATPALGEANALGCPDPVLRALHAPLGALLGVLRASTEEQLMRRTRAGELAMAALGAAFAVETAEAPAGEHDVPTGAAAGTT
jgi:hypothetical protein